jgi:hypothetical protein
VNPGIIRIVDATGVILFTFFAVFFPPVVYVAPVQSTCRVVVRTIAAALPALLALSLANEFDPV